MPYLTKVRLKLIKQDTLSGEMVSVLTEACEKQMKGILFGPHNVQGSFTTLIKRGLITRKKVIIDGRASEIWHVTTEGLESFKSLGV